MNFDFTVVLSEPAPGPVSVNVNVTPGTATAGSDYTLPSTSPLVFAIGETVKTAQVTVNGDGLYELDETFTAAHNPNR